MYNKNKTLFEIKLDEEVALIFFIEHLLGWTTSELLIELKSEENQAALNQFIKHNKNLLSQASSIILDPRERTDLIWSVYTKEVNLSNKKGYSSLNLIIALFTPIFNTIWNSELNRMSEYVHIFNKQFTKKHSQFIIQMHSFLQSTYDLNSTICVYMLPCSNLTLAKTHKKHSIVLVQHANCFKKQSSTLIAIIHEYIHLLQHHSTSDNMLKKAFTSKDVLTRLSSIESPPQLSYAAREILAHSIASALSPSYYADIFPDEAYLMHDINYYNSKSFNKESNDYDQWYEHFRIIAYRSIPILRLYMDKNKTIDQAYCDNLAKLTRDYLS